MSAGLPAPVPPEPKRRVRLAALLVLAVAAAVYANTLTLGFVWDDDWLILNDPHIGDWGHLRHLFLEKTLWRPLKRLSLMVDYALWGPERPYGFHLTNVALHALASVLLLYAYRAIGAGLRVATTGALLFAVHPIHVEAVATITHRKEPMALVFTLLAFLAYLEARKPGGTAMARRIALLSATFLCYLLGMLAKDVGAVMLPAVLLAYELLLAGRGDAGRGDAASRRRSLARLSWLALCCLPVLAIFTARGYIGTLARRFGAEQIRWVSGGETESYGRILLGALKAFGQYVGLLVWPSPLYLDRAFVLPHSLLEPGPLLGLVALSLWGLGLLWSWRRVPLAAFAFLWYGLNLVPVLNLVPLTHWLIAERFAYVPSAGFTLLLALGFERMIAATGQATRAAARRAGCAAPFPVPVLVLALLLTVHAALTVRQNRIWRDNGTLWGFTLRYHPDSVRALHGHALAIGEQGDEAASERQLRRAIALDPVYPEARYALARLLLKRGDYPEAIVQAEIHARLEPKDPEPWIVIGNAHYRTSRPDLAALAYREAVRRAPGHEDARFNLATALHAAGRLEEALAATDGAGEDAALLRLRGNVLLKLGRDAEALAALRGSLALEPDQPKIREAVRRLESGSR